MAEIKTINGRGLYDTVARQKCENLENNKANKAHTHTLDNITETSSRKIMTTAERTKLSNVAEGANNYVHPSSHPASIITGFRDAIKSYTDSAVTETGQMPVSGSAVTDAINAIFSFENGTLDIITPDYTVITSQAASSDEDLSTDEVTNNA